MGDDLARRVLALSFDQNDDILKMIELDARHLVPWQQCLLVAEALLTQSEVLAESHSFPGLIGAQNLGKASGGDFFLNRVAQLPNLGDQGRQLDLLAVIPMHGVCPLSDMVPAACDDRFVHGGDVVPPKDPPLFAPIGKDKAQIENVHSHVAQEARGEDHPAPRQHHGQTCASKGETLAYRVQAAQRLASIATRVSGVAHQDEHHAEYGAEAGNIHKRFDRGTGRQVSRVAGLSCLVAGRLAAVVVGSSSLPGANPKTCPVCET